MKVVDKIDNVKQKILATIKDIKESEVYKALNNSIHQDKYYSSKQLILDKIKEYDTIVIHRHIRPDGDAIGSSLGLRQALREAFPEKKIYSVGANAPEYVKFIGEEDEVEDEVYENALAIVLDTATSDRIFDERYKNAKEVIKIDHHLAVENYGTINFVRDNFGACALIITDFLISFEEFDISPETARYLYIATVTDTGRFKYSETDATALQLASILLSVGVDTEDMYAHLYVSNKEDLIFKGWVYNNFQVSDNGVAYIYITEKIRKKFKLTYEDAANNVNSLDCIKGSMIWILFIEQDGEIRVRLRSRFVPINELANAYNGGGHVNACGATVYNKKQVSALIKDADKLLKSYKEKNKEKF